MKNVTVRLSDEYVETLDEEADDSDMSRAKYLRDLIEQGREAKATQRELEATQAKVEDLRRQLQQANSRERDVDELVAYVEEERKLQRRREDREQRHEERRQANVFRRAWWYLAGAPADEPMAE
jgi:predicted transcriptional regulator